MSLFDFCRTGAHARCPGSFRGFFFEGKRRVDRDHSYSCSCTCHTKENSE